MKKKIIDITSKIEFGDNDEELLPITKCACGHKFEFWKFTISIYEDNPYECPYCKRKMFFRTNIQVFEIEENKL